MKSKNLLLTILSFSSFISTPVMSSSPDDANELANLMALLEQQTTLATKTKLNADYVPGMLSILHGDKLENQGFRTVWEGLSAMPGIQISTDSSGEPLIIVRGVGKTFASGKVKVLLNSVPINTTVSATAHPVFELPIQQVDRIEFVRGPGSAVHGEFAYVGVINVITRQDNNQLYIATGHDETYQAGGVITWNDAESKLNGSLSFSGLNTNGEDLKTGVDAFGAFEPSYAPGQANTAKKKRSVLFNTNYKDFVFSAQWLENKRGDFFGINDSLPPPVRRLTTTTEVLAIQGEHIHQFSKNLETHVKLSWTRTENEKDDQFVAMATSFGGALDDPDIVADTALREQRVQGSVSGTWRGLERHIIFGEISASKTEVNLSNQFLNLDPVTFVPTTEFHEFPTPTNTDQERRLMSVTLQDEFHLNEDITLTTGLRYDEYDDVGSNLSPRIAVVWRVSQQHVFKAQYASAFRPPTFLELGGAFFGDIDPETINTFELGYIYKNKDTTVRNTLFYSDLDDLITFSDVDFIGFSNIGSASMKGYELELSHRFDHQWQITSNVSYLDSENKTTGEPVYGSSKWLANFNVNYLLYPNVNLNAHFNYIGKRQREADDVRSIMDDYFRTDITITVQNLLDTSGLAFRGGIKNLFKNENRFQARNESYVDDYPGSDDTLWWLQLSYTP